MFSVQQFIADAQLERFEYLDREGNLRSLPHLKSLPLGIAARMEAGDEAALDEIQPGLAEEIEGMPGIAANALIRAWREHSGVAEGESEASSPSSAGSTAGRSKRTSAGTGKSRTRKR